MWLLGWWLEDFPGGSGGKEPTCQCRRCKRCGFDPWVWKIPWRGKWLPTPVFVPGDSHGQRSLKGYRPRGCKELDTTENLSTDEPQEVPVTEAQLWTLNVFVSSVYLLSGFVFIFGVFRERCVCKGCAWCLFSRREGWGGGHWRSKISRERLTCQTPSCPLPCLLHPYSHPGLVRVADSQLQRQRRKAGEKIPKKN